MSGVLANLDNREIALLYWIAATLIWMLCKPATRKSLSGVLKALLAKPILFCLILMTVYVCLEVVFLEALGIWTSGEIKVTVMWAVTTACIMLFNINSISEDERFFRKTFRENFKLAVLIDFFVNFHVFPLVAEIVLIPFAAVLGGMIAYCDTDEEKYSVTKRFLNNVLFFLGLCLLIYATWKAIMNINAMASWETLKSLAMPILLSILYLPFIFLAVTYSAYENVFCRLQFVMKNATLHPYTKKQLVIKVRFNLPVLKVWLKSAWQRDFQTKQDVLVSIHEAVAKHTQK